jgi:hypothetical protein
MPVYPGAFWRLSISQISNLNQVFFRLKNQLYGQWNSQINGSRNRAYRYTPIEMDTFPGIGHGWYPTLFGSIEDIFRANLCALITLDTFFFIDNWRHNTAP